MKTVKLNYSGTSRERGTPSGREKGVHNWS